VARWPVKLRQRERRVFAVRGRRFNSWPHERQSGLSCSAQVRYLRGLTIYTRQMSPILSSILETAATTVCLFALSLWGTHRAHKKLREQNTYYSWKGFTAFWVVWVGFFVCIYYPPALTAAGYTAAAPIVLLMASPAIIAWAWPVIAIVGFFVIANAIFPSKGA